MVLDFLKGPVSEKTPRTKKSHSRYFEDDSRIQGVYKDALVVYQVEKKQFCLVQLLRVDGVNMDILSVHEQAGLNEDFGTFLSQNILYEPQITSLNSPITIQPFLDQWEKTVENYRKSSQPNEALLQLKASYLVEYQKLQKTMETSKKQHFVALSEKLSQLSPEGIEIAYEGLKDKVRGVRSGLQGFMGKFDCQVTICTIQETRTIFRKYF
ncbi:hypothetical protein [Enterococcus faecalis]|uniref:hypothetical protein n=1 Tax=Enterococcus faecalis TaxID=1351 RepID=UPI00243131CE|nr:hypothetical protein [Enterococcus faecalis]